MSEFLGAMYRFVFGCLAGAGLAFGLALFLGGLSPYHVIIFGGLCGLGYMLCEGERSKPA